MIPITEQRVRKTGVSDMDITFYPAMGAGGQRVPSVLAGLWVHFEDISGSGVSSNTIAVRILGYDSETNFQLFDQCVDSKASVGMAASSVGTDYILTVSKDYLHKYILEVDPEDPNRFDKIRVTWTNDADGDVGWGVKALIIPTSAFPAGSPQNF